MTPAPVVILVGTSPTDAADALALGHRATRLGAEVAFLQMARPPLGEVLDRLADSGATDVVLVGASGGVGGPGVSWLRRVAAAWWATRRGSIPTLATATTYLDDDAEWDALVTAARPITTPGPGLTSPAWEDVPSHERQVFVCRGPRCTAAGVEEVWRSLVRELVTQALGDDDVLVTQTGCQFPCNQAPVVTVQPDDVWYGRLDPASAAEVVTSHLVGGVPLERVRLPRRRVTRNTDEPGEAPSGPASA